ncbi:efflux transporter periplasmic adaptor subunit [Niastella koreensis]|uniref:Efflux transporter, RND family, MFP subunit n=2 Tax=Niastella koreensis TaxID=354356 RepID=G8TA62_NIAKG|nr:efflux RND transporter periplasmic adaptor subunit [Niastella koreensis]AEW02434.1 efflux transporter, RND family, MFP subunit [Niastella koreensis GR20-10]OQP54808.1 efflux transporter periplasmic adaptor subunit [Niastella koreensis]
MLQNKLFYSPGSRNSSQLFFRLSRTFGRERYLVRLVFCSALFLLATACKNKKPVEAVKADVYYTCSMHPQVVQDKPGNCPICHMELIPVKKTNETKDEIMLSNEQIQLGNIQTDTLGSALMGDKVVLTATLNFDEMKVNTVSARITGRIDRLYFKNNGDFIKKGDHLFDLYSEELNTAKQEYLAALERQQTLGNSIIDFKQLLQSAKNKLLLWGVSESQIDALAKTKQFTPLTAFYSTASGYVTELPVKEGQYVTEGSVVVKLADLSTLWAEAQVYASQLASVDYQGVAMVQLPDLPGAAITGKVTFANPEISTDTRINLLRISIPNTNNQLKPGMPAYVVLKSRAGNALTLPIDAVLRNGQMAMVWVQTAGNTYRRRMVETGLESGDRIEIRSGLQNGDVVVISGAYLLNSEYVFKKGSAAMEGHMH